MTVSHICKSVRDSGNHDNKFRAGPGKNFNFIMMAYFRSDLLYAPSNFTYLELDKSTRVALFNVFRRNPNGTVNYILIPTILAHRTCHTLDSRQNFLFQPLRTRNTQVFFQLARQFSSLSTTLSYGQDVRLWHAFMQRSHADPPKRRLDVDDFWRNIKKVHPYNSSIGNLV